jgi:restriction system protein
MRATTVAMWNHSDVRIPWLDELHSRECPFCHTKTLTKKVENIWTEIPKGLEKQHRSTMRSHAEMNGNYLLEDQLILSGPDEESVDCCWCPVCGYWFVLRIFWISTKHQLWQMYYAIAGSLRDLDLRDHSVPISEIKKYLAARYQSRFELSPRKLEEVVASVFRSLGYRAELTSYSNDGGIDVVLQDWNGEVTALQVKRYKNSIKVEQIRSFIGALILQGTQRGIFVTTSRYQAGCRSIAKIAPMELDLIDAQKLFELVKLSQIAEADCYPAFLSEGNVKPPKLHFVEELHMNSM